MMQTVRYCLEINAFLLKVISHIDRLGVRVILSTVRLLHDSQIFW